MKFSHPDGKPGETEALINRKELKHALRQHSDQPVTRPALSPDVTMPQTLSCRHIQPSTAIVLQAIAVPSAASRIASFRIDAPAPFQSDFVVPWDVEVVLIQKTAALAQFQIVKRNL